MSMLYPIMLTTATNLGIFSSVFIKMMTDSMDEDSGKSEKEETSEALLTMLGLGVGEILGSLVWGKVIDKCNIKYTVIFNILAVTIGFMVLLVYTARYEFGNGLAIVMTFTFGF